MAVRHVAAAAVVWLGVAGSLPAAPAAAPVRHTDAPQVRRTALISSAQAAACSGTLVGPRLVLTAGHCLSSAGEPVAAVTARVGYHRTRAGRARWQLRCAGSRAWVASADPVVADPGDWGLLELGACVDRGEEPVSSPPGDVVGHHDVTVLDADDVGAPVTYLGYPDPDGAAASQRSLWRVRGPVLPVGWWRFPAPESAFVRVRYPVGPGGSGGPLLRRVAGRWQVVAVDVFAMREEAYFVRVTPGMVARVEAAAVGAFPPGTWMLATGLLAAPEGAPGRTPGRRPRP